MTEQKKNLDIAKLDQEFTTAIEGMKVERTDFLAKLSDDMLDDVSGGMQEVHGNGHGNVHGNVSVT
jgi:hypothetical protein